MFNANNANGYSLADIAAVTNGGFGGGVNSILPVLMEGNGNNGWGENGFGWIIVLFILAALGGWGGFGGFGGWGMGNMMGLGMADGFGAFPWLLASNANNQNATNAGFDSLALGNTLSGIQSSVNSGFGDTALGIAGINQNICATGNGIQNTLCQGFSGTTAAINGAQNAIAQQLYTNEIGNLNRSFAEQTANSQGFQTLSSDLASCCCENRLSNADLKYTIATENCADRSAISDGVRDILAATQAQTQTILDRLCQQEIDALKTQNANLQTQVNMQNLAASQAAQTAALAADNAAQTQYIVNRVAPYPIPAYPVSSPYGYNSFNPYFANGYGCGCGYNNLVA